MVRAAASPGAPGRPGPAATSGSCRPPRTYENQRSNVTSLRSSVEQLEASYEADRIDRFQVDLARQALYNAQSQLLTAEAGFQQSVENFKVGIGLPPEIPVVLTDTVLDQFDLLDPGLEALRNRVSDVLATFREARDAEAEAPAILQGAIASARDVPYQIEVELEKCAEDIVTLEKALPERRAELQRLARRPEVEAAEIDESLFSAEALEERFHAKRSEYRRLRDQVLTRAAELEELFAAVEAGDPDAASLVKVGSELSGLLLEVALVQASVRLDTISFEPVEIEPEEALRIASAYRRDWKNARASLVDAWRLIYFNANDLKSDLDIVFSGDIGNVGDHPFDLRGTNGRLRVGLEFDAPLTRLEERNIYRQSLIEYQQARREYYRYRDRVYQSLRKHAQAGGSQRGKPRTPPGSRPRGDRPGRPHPAAALAARRCPERRPNSTTPPHVIWCSRSPICSMCRTTC